MTKSNIQSYRNMSEDELLEKLTSLKIEHSQIKSNIQRGLIKENQGKVQPVKKDVARVLTVLNELRSGKN
ncbi:MAG: 50S ribosomal protein L29 [Thaumarchaeota archaeon]|jgi:large subunit ribosomal protein L29|nr:50S ribosomal protein L29 [Nitrososphaerales archaeon]NSL73892.1 50S ribosomal protein L29 [Nitrososphaerota archaeon]